MTETIDHTIDLAPARITSVEVETVIQRSPTEVWNALTTGIADWWPEPFHCGGEEGKRTIRFEARPGGLMVEEWGGDDGLVWAQVLSVERPRKLQVVGYGFAEWGGPNTWFGTWTLEVEGGATRLRFSEDAVGAHPERYRDEKEKGWRFLFDGCLRAFLEGREPPAWG